MASSDRTPDMSRVISDLSRAIHQLTDKVDGLGGSGRPGTGGGRAKTNDLDLKSTQKDFKKLSETLKLTEKEIRDLRRGFSDTNRSLEDLYQAQNDAAKGIIANDRLSARSQKNLVESINNTIRHYSFMGQSMVNAGKKIEFLEEKMEETGKFLSQYGDILKDVNAISLSSITDHDKLKKALTKLNKEMVLSDDVQEMIRKNEFARAARALDDEARNATTIRTSIRRTSNSFGNLTRVTDGLKDGVKKATDAVGLGFVKEAAQWGGALGLIATGVKQAYSQFWQNASAGFGGAFIQLSTTAIKLGISLDALNRITKENMNLVGKMGLRGFTDSLKDSQQQLMQLGLTTEEAAKTKAVMIENAFLTGVDVKNKKALAKSANEQIAAYENMRAVTGESIEALAAQTKAIISDNDSTKIMASLNKQQRIQLVQSINAERQRLVTMGLTNDAAINVIKTFQQIQNSKLGDRLDAGYGAMAASSALGIDPAKAAKAQQILQGGRAAMKNPENAKFMADFAQELTAKSDQLQGTGDVNSQILGEYADEMTSALQPIKDSMRQANLDRGLTPAEVEANKALGKVPAAIAEGSAKLESWMRLLESPLTKIMVGVLGIGALLLKHLGKPKSKGEIPAAEPRVGKGSPDNEGHVGTVGARPGDSVHGSDRFSSQMTQVAKKHGWTEKQYAQEQGLAGNQKLTRDIQAAKAEAARRKNDQGRQEDNKKGIGSDALKQKLEENRKKVEARIAAENALQGPPTPPRARTLADRIDDLRERTGRGVQGGVRRVSTAVSTGREQLVNRVNGFGDRITQRAMNSAPGRTMGAIGRAGSATLGAARGAVGSVASAGMGAIGKAAGGIMAFGARALPLIGIAVTAIEGLKGAFDAVDRSAEIFGVDTKKNAVTTAQKVSAGIAGALNTISFGLIPTDDTARLLNDVATDGVQVLTDYWEEAMEWVYNKGIPALYDGFKSVMGWIGSAIMDALSPSTWIAAFTGEGGDGGIVQTILRSLYKGVQFLGTALMKGAIKVGSDMIEGMINLIPDWAGGKAAREGFAKMKKESENGGLLGFAASDTKFSDTDTPEEAKKRKEREAKKAERDKKSKGDQHGEGPVQGTASGTPEDNLGMVTQFGQQLTADQLRAQGVQGTPASSGTPSVDNPSGQGPASPGGASSGSGSNASTQSNPPKSPEETILAEIRDKMSTLVELTDKNFKLNQEEFKFMTTRQRLGNNQPASGASDGYSPSLAAFLNLPL